MSEFGDPDQLQIAETADPHPEAGQCLIAIEACDVLFLDTMLRRGGMAPPEMSPKLPWIPGNGVAGRVVAVGDGVTEDWIGLLGRRAHRQPRRVRRASSQCPPNTSWRSPRASTCAPRRRCSTTAPPP